MVFSMQIEAVNSTQMVDPPNGMDRFFREDHHPIRRLKDRSDKPGATIDQNGMAGNAREMSGGIKAVKRHSVSAGTIRGPAVRECP